MAKTKGKTNSIPYKCIACCFQGGGALGAYQVGVVRALDEAGYDSDWYVGTSIGAINAAIAAGNPPETRVEKMHQFWEDIATPSFIESNLMLDDETSRKMQHLLSSYIALFYGQPHFFTPRIPPLLTGYYDTPNTLSFYDTKILKETLERHIDFDRINSKHIRLSVGAVEICTGEMTYFDSTETKIRAEHIMASGALPPGFPAVEIEGKFYWDGGLSSNSPATYVLNFNRCPKDMLCFTIHLFDSYNLYPRSLDQVLNRKKDLEFSSKFSKLLELYQQMHTLKNSIHMLSHYIPKDLKSNPDIAQCIAQGHESRVSLVRFLYEHDPTEFSSKDFEFSQKTIKERINTGYLDGKKAIKKSPWNNTPSPFKGLTVYDMSPHGHLIKSKDS